MAFQYNIKNSPSAVSDRDKTPFGEFFVDIQKIEQLKMFYVDFLKASINYIAKSREIKIFSGV